MEKNRAKSVLEEGVKKTNRGRFGGKNRGTGRKDRGLRERVSTRDNKNRESEWSGGSPIEVCLRHCLDLSLSFAVDRVEFFFYLILAP